MSIRNLDRLLAPRSVAVIGASSRAGSVEATVWRNLLAGAFTDAQLPVNRPVLPLLGRPRADGQRGPVAQRASQAGAEAP